MRTLVCLLVIAFCTACPADKDKEPVKEKIQNSTKARGNALKALDKRRKAKVSPQD